MEAVPTGRGGWGMLRGPWPQNTRGGSGHYRYCSKEHWRWCEALRCWDGPGSGVSLHIPWIEPHSGVTA